MTDPMAEERLAEIRAAAEQYRGSLIVRNKPNGAIAHRGELLDEVDRLDGHLAAIKKAQAESVAARRKLDEMHEQEVAELRARLAEIGEIREEWRFDDGMGKFTVKLTPLSDADVRYLRQQTERPVEHRFVGDWRDTAASAQGDATEGEDG